MSIFMGIDPGVSGGYAVLELEGSVINILDAANLPVWRYEKMAVIDAVEYHAVLEKYRIDLVLVEKTVMPTNAKAMFQGGAFQGSLFAITQFHGTPLDTVFAATWKKHFKLTLTKQQAAGLSYAKKNTQNKKQAMQLARSKFGAKAADKYFPLMKHEGVAEACLIGLYAIERRQATPVVATK